MLEITLLTELAYPDPPDSSRWMYHTDQRILYVHTIDYSDADAIPGADQRMDFERRVMEIMTMSRYSVWSLVVLSFLSLSLILAFVRLWRRGPSLPDRVIALDIATRHSHGDYLRVTPSRTTSRLSWMWRSSWRCFPFWGTVAFAYYIERRV